MATSRYSPTTYLGTNSREGNQSVSLKSLYVAPAVSSAVWACGGRVYDAHELTRAEGQKVAHTLFLGTGACGGRAFDLYDSARAEGQKVAHTLFLGTGACGGRVYDAHELTRAEGQKVAHEVPAKAVRSMCSNWKVFIRSQLSVGGEGVEPSRPCGQGILSPPCLPFHHPPEITQIAYR